MDSFGAKIFAYVVTELDTYTTSINHVLLGSWPARTIVTIYIILVGYAILKGHAGEHAKEFGISILLLIVLQGTIMLPGGMSEWIAQPMLDLTQGLSNLGIGSEGGAGTGSAATGIFVKLDDGLGRIMTALSRIDPPGNFFQNAWLHIKVGFASFFLALAYCLAYLAFLALFTMAVFSLYMMFMVGAFFVWFASFKATRHLTWTWVRATFNYVLWAFFLSVVMGFMTTLLDKSIDSVTQWDLAIDGAAPPDFFGILFICALTVYFLIKAGDLSAALTGGTSSSAGIVTTGLSVASSAAGTVGGIAGSGAKAAGGMAWGGIRGGASRAWSAMKGVK